ncbi:Oidioi.mRNA.OKI2018_I69.chr1.g33.t1.cds [Oikopleura dioica]|uniref:Oidioi.mRNA.OKI2018_I69.chr1.g33.t1.cds n=1 Tax=Oikopleura dioica TaxID=34765 RepID=A0ABN7SIK6_OIKDI|nr:Oidioi.mRNA.OKI2018_I69.chr1.g33.t1.cds [Oikopleura dioica]
MSHIFSYLAPETQFTAVVEWNSPGDAAIYNSENQHIMDIKTPPINIGKWVLSYIFCGMSCCNIGNKEVDGIHPQYGEILALKELDPGTSCFKCQKGFNYGIVVGQTEICGSFHHSASLCSESDTFRDPQNNVIFDISKEPVKTKKEEKVKLTKKRQVIFSKDEKPVCKIDSKFTPKKTISTFTFPAELSVQAKICLMMYTAMEAFEFKDESQAFISNMFGGGN